jgi:hypothetical protein
MGEGLVRPRICFFDLAQILVYRVDYKIAITILQKSNPRHTLEFFVTKTLISRSHEGVKIIRGLYPEKMPSKEIESSELRKEVETNRR